MQPPTPDDAMILCLALEVYSRFITEMDGPKDVQVRSRELLTLFKNREPEEVNKFVEGLSV